MVPSRSAIGNTPWAYADSSVSGSRREACISILDFRFWLLDWERPPSSCTNSNLTQQSRIKIENPSLRPRLVELLPLLRLDHLLGMLRALDCRLRRGSFEAAGDRVEATDQLQFRRRLCFRFRGRIVTVPKVPQFIRIGGGQLDLSLAANVAELS